MPDPDDEESLEKSKMSFGEHLEELRSALFKSLGALAAGAAIGLLIGQWVVDEIQTPLRDALAEHYRARVEADELARLEQLRAEGAPVPDDLPAAAKTWAEQGLVPKTLLIDPRQAAEALHKKYPDAVPPDLFPSETPAEAALIERADLIELRVYEPLAADSRLRLIGTKADEPFFVWLKASLATGAIVASPFIFFFIWEFIAAGLYKQERRYIYMYLPISLGLFIAGAALAFYVAFDYVLNFLFQFYAWTGTDPTPRLGEWMGFVLMLPLGFGISFQLPMVMLLLQRIGVFSIEDYLSKWRVAILVIAVVSMFLTPADPGSMIVMATPLVALYFLGIALCRYMPGHGLNAPPGEESVSGRAKGEARQ